MCLNQPQYSRRYLKSCLKVPVPSQAIFDLDTQLLLGQNKGNIDKLANYRILLEISGLAALHSKSQSRVAWYGRLVGESKTFNSKSADLCGWLKVPVWDFMASSGIPVSTD
jgi:hypothetical protein